MIFDGIILPKSGAGFLHAEEFDWGKLEVKTPFSYGRSFAW